MPAGPPQSTTAKTSSPSSTAPGPPCRAGGRTVLAFCLLQTNAFENPRHRPAHHPPQNIAKQRLPARPRAPLPTVSPKETRAVIAVVVDSGANTFCMLLLRSVKDQPFFS